MFKKKNKTKTVKRAHKGNQATVTIKTEKDIVKAQTKCKNTGIAKTAKKTLAKIEAQEKSQKELDKKVDNYNKKMFEKMKKHPDKKVDIIPIQRQFNVSKTASKTPGKSQMRKTSNPTHNSATKSRKSSVNIYKFYN